MVVLQLQIQIDAPFQDVWRFFKELQNVPQWDPNMKNAQIIKKTQHQVGSLYNMKSSVYGFQSILHYQTTLAQQSSQRGYRCFEGSNSQMRAIDEITCSKQTANSTVLNWKADLSMKGIYWYFTPFAYPMYKKLQRDARQGCVKKAIQIFGNARQIF